LANKRDIELIENNDTTVEVTVTQDGDAYDLTGKTVEFYAKANRTEADADAVMTYTTANGRVVIVEPATGGRLDIAFDGDDVQPGKYPYHLDIIDADGDRHTVAYGTVNVINV
jgi:hypothetical protein